MWDKIFIGVLAGFLLTGCGQSADGQAVGEEPVTSGESQTMSSDNSASPSLSEYASDSLGTKSSGRLPATEPPASVKQVQAKFQDLLSNGVPVEKFANLEVKPAQSISGSTNGRKLMIEDSGNYRMFLVRSHLTKVESDDCETGNYYQAWIAAQPDLFVQITEPAIRTMVTRPYRVSICEDGDKLNYSITDIGSALSPSP